jgi:tRNA pseudouridine55 synthase
MRLDITSRWFKVADRIILIDKPLRWTSFDVVKKLRKPLLEERRREAPLQERKLIKNFKVGHAGTLDPLATGLLIICTGKQTKNIHSIQSAEKEYTGTITIGSTTSSFDLEQPPENFQPTDHVTEEMIFETAKMFVGEQMQTAPIHSAKKIDGQRAYDKARKGDQFELKAHRIEIRVFEITRIRIPEISFRVVCTKGTYIRSLADDFGKKLGTGAHLSTLCRTRIGDFRLEDAVSPDEFLRQLSDKERLQSQ